MVVLTDVAAYPNLSLYKLWVVGHWGFFEGHDSSGRTTELYALLPLSGRVIKNKPKTAPGPQQSTMITVHQIEKNRHKI